MKKENKIFLKSLSEKTVIWNNVSMRTNISLTVFNTKMSSYTEYVMSQKEFDRVFEILKQEDDIFIFPQESLMGYIEGYNIYTLKGKLLLRFGRVNMINSSNDALQKIFDDVVLSERNLLIIKRAKKVFHQIKENYSDYCY